MLSQGPYNYNRFDAYEKQLQEIAQYQPPPVPQAPAPIIQQSNQPAPEARQAPTAGQKAPAAKNNSYFSAGSNLAGKMGMKAGGDQASVVVDGTRGIVSRMNDGIPRRTYLSTDERTGQEYVHGETDLDAANPLQGNWRGKGAQPDNSGMYSHRPIEKDMRGRASIDVLDHMQSSGPSGMYADVNPRGSGDVQMGDRNAIGNYQQSLMDKDGSSRNYKSTRAPMNFVRGRGY